MDRALAYRALARLFRPPDAESLDVLRMRELPELTECLARLGVDATALDAALRVSALLADGSVDAPRVAYERTFEPSGGLPCPPHETAHTVRGPQHAMRRTYELADVAGFYRAFGVEPQPGGERPDHVTVELEFMHLLALKEAVARADEGPRERVRLCHEAQRAFLRDHLAPFAPALARALEGGAEHPAYAAAGALLEAFVTWDASQQGTLTA